MNPQTKSGAKDFFLNLGATVSLYTVVGSLINLLFTVINVAYPQITNSYYVGSSSISWSVATLIIFTPLLILLMWLVNKQYTVEAPSTIHKWLTYITLFIAGLLLAGDLITVIYYFIDGQELTTGFLLKILTVLVISGSVFTYYISDMMGKLTSKSRMAWRVFAFVVVIGSIVWGFAVLGSPRTQRLYKYDDAKINDLMSINSAVQSYYYAKGVLPKDFTELSTLNYYINSTDSQSQKPYEYNIKTKNSYEVCADFNNASNDNGTTGIAYPYGGPSWTHPAGRYCFEQTITVVNTSGYPVKLPM